MQKKRYPSDVSREQFERVRLVLESARKRTKPRKVDLHDVFNGVLYVLKTGCQWRALPHEYPAWETVYTYFRAWGEEVDGNPSVLDGILKKIGWRGPAVQWSARADQHGHR